MVLRMLNHSFLDHYSLYCFTAPWPPSKIGLLWDRLADLIQAMLSQYAALIILPGMHLLFNLR